MSGSDYLTLLGIYYTIGVPIIIISVICGMVYVTKFLGKICPDMWWLALLLSFFFGPAGQAYYPGWVKYFAIIIVMQVVFMTTLSFSIVALPFLSLAVMGMRLVQIYSDKMKMAEKKMKMAEKIANEDYISTMNRVVVDKKTKTYYKADGQNLSENANVEEEIVAQNYSESSVSCEKLSPLWYVSIDGKNRKGPLRESVVVSMIESGEIGGEHLAWVKGMDNWSKIKDIEIFKDIFLHTPPPLS